MPDTSNIKVGDVVHVRMCVTDVSPRGLVCVNQIDGGWYDASCIVHVEPRPLQVGDRVTYGSRDGIVRALEGGCAWVKWTAKDYSTWPVEALKRVDAPATEGA